MVGERRISPVVDHVAAALHGAVFQVVDPQALPAAQHVVDDHAVLAQELQAGGADGVIGQAGDKFRRQPEIGQRNRDVRFAAAVDHVEAARLLEAQLPGRRQAEHDFTESDDAGHDFLRGDERRVVNRVIR